MLPTYSYINSTSIKVSSTGLPKTIAAVKKQFETFFPGNLFDHYFLDERFNEQYKQDRLFGNVFGIFAALAIFIACLGLFGLSLYTISQRTKEIGAWWVFAAAGMLAVSIALATIGFHALKSAMANPVNALRSE